MKHLIPFFLILALFSACNSTDDSNTIMSYTEAPPAGVEPVDPGDDPGEPTVPGDDPGEPEEDPIMAAKALLFYDGSVKSWDGAKVAKLRDAARFTRAGNYFIFDTSAETLDGKTKWDVGQNAERACMWGGKLFLYADKRLYMADVKGKAAEIAYNQYEHIVSLTPDGVSFELVFFNESGAVIDGQFGGYESILKLFKNGSTWYKYIYVAGEWVQVGQGNYSDFVRCHSLDIAGKTYYTKGAILDRAGKALIEPSFDSTVKQFKGGSAFRQYIQPIVKAGDCKPHLIGIGVADGNGYFLNARTGKVVRYNPGSDTLTDWIELVPGVGSDDKVASEALFEKTAAFICERDIIFYDGAKIQRVNIDTGEKNEIADATGMRGWAL